MTISGCCTKVATMARTHCNAKTARLDYNRYTDYTKLVHLPMRLRVYLGMSYIMQLLTCYCCTLQVYSLDQGSALAGLQMFKDVGHFKVICCGGDGTVGWVLETMG